MRGECAVLQTEAMQMRSDAVPPTLTLALTPTPTLTLTLTLPLTRCHLLVSRASRLRSPRLVVCNHDARLLPEHLGTQGALAAAEDAAAAGQAEPASWLSSLLEIFGNLFCIPACGTAAPVTPLRFDRVLCDVLV